MCGGPFSNNAVAMSRHVWWSNNAVAMSRHVWWSFFK